MGHLRMQRTRQLIFRRHDLPSYRTRSRQGALNHANNAGSFMSKSVTFVEELAPEPLLRTLHPNIIFEDCVNVCASRQLRSKAAKTSDWLVRCYFSGNTYRTPLLAAHTLGTDFKDEGQEKNHDDPEKPLPTSLNGAHDMQSTQEEGTSAVLSVSSAEIEIDSCPTKDQGSLDELQMLEDGSKIRVEDSMLEDPPEEPVDPSTIHSNESSADPLSIMNICFILEHNGWGPITEARLQQFVAKLTPDLVACVVSHQKDAKVALSFLEWAGEQDAYEHRAHTFTKVVGRLGKNRDFAAAWNVLESMKRHGLDVNYAFSVFIHRLKRAHMVDGLVKAMDSMSNLNIIPTVPLYTLALEPLLSANNLREARRLYWQMLHSGLLPDKKLYGVLISGLGRAGKLADSLHFFTEMKKRGISPDSFVYISLVRSYYAAGKCDEAKKVLKEMIHNGCFPKVFTPLELACALHGENTMEQIKIFLEDITINGHVLSVYTYHNMLQYLLDVGKLCEAVALFRMSGSVQDVDGNFQESTNVGLKQNLDSYALLTVGLCKAGKIVEALDLFHELLASGLKPNAAICNNLLFSLSNAETIDKAFEFCDHIQKQKVIVNVVVQRAFLSAIRASGQLSKGLKVFDTLKCMGCINQRSNFHSLIGLEK